MHLERHYAFYYNGNLKISKNNCCEYWICGHIVKDKKSGHLVSNHMSIVTPQSVSALWNFYFTSEFSFGRDNVGFRWGL